MMMVMVMMMQGTILTRAHENLDPEHASTKALAPELRLQYQRVRNIGTKSGTEDVGPPDDDHVDADEGPVQSCVALDLMMVLLILMLVIMMMSVIVVMMVLSKLVLNWTS